MLAAGPGPALASPVIRQALIPMAVFYLIFMTALGLGLAGLRRGKAGRPAGPAAGPRRGWAPFARQVLGTAAGGYLLLLAVAAAYYYLVARVGGSFLSSAVTGTALLIGLTMPIFAALAWAAARAGGRPGRRPRGDGPPGPGPG
ncbi:MAG: DUF6256 family protein [Gemmatimonadota bacterium]